MIITPTRPVMPFQCGGSVVGPKYLISLLPQNTKWKADGTTYVKNVGKGKPDHNGTPYAANHLWLNGVDQSIDYQSGEAHLTYYDSAAKAFVQESPTGSTYNMTKSHQLYMTQTKALTPAELAQLNMDPNLIMLVWFDDLVLADGFQKSYIVDFCVPIDSYSNKYVQNIAKSKVNLRPNNQLPPEGDVNNLRITHTANGFMVEVLSNGGLQTDPILFNNDIVPQNTPFCGFTVNVSNRMRFYRVYGPKSETHTAIGEYKCSFGGNITSPGKYDILTCCEDNFSLTSNFFAYFSTQAEDISIGDTVEFTDFWAYDIESYEVVNYTDACRSTLVNQDFGITNFLLSQDAAGLPTGTMSTFTGSDDGRKITVDGNDYAITVSCAKRLYGDDPSTLTIEEC